MVKVLFNPDFGLTWQMENGEIYINFGSALALDNKDESYFKVMGFVLGKCLTMGITLSI